MPGLANADLKLHEVIFYKAKVNKSDLLRISLAVQKPLYCVQNDDFGSGNNKATYTLTLYDDDQVEVTRKLLHVTNNPPDARTETVTWTPTLSGAAYLTISCENTGNKIYLGKGHPAPGPGRVAIQVTKAQTAEVR